MGEAACRLFVGAGTNRTLRGGCYYHSSVPIGRKISTLNSPTLATFSHGIGGRRIRVEARGPRRYGAEEWYHGVSHH
jgi:hypothetical protein